MTETDLLGGRYELGERLGYGGMADVRHGRDVRLGRDVAVKMLRADLARDPSFQTRFRREAQSAASLNHPSIVAVYDTGEQSVGDRGSVPYIVMEYVSGRTLRDILQTEGRLQPQRALEITADMLEALDYSHQHGIIHRDIKPANVMLTDNGEVKVMDFGIARAITGASATLTQTAAVIGTAQYLSPEQARGEHVDARSDIYSAGCLLYELLTGSPPFTGDSPVSVAYQHVREDPVPPSQIDPELSPSIDAIVLKALAKNPANRYQSAAEMRADIDRALAGRPVEATPLLPSDTMVAAPMPAAPTTVLLRRPEPPRRGRRGLAYLLLALAAIAVFVVAMFLVRALVPTTATGDVKAPAVTGMPLAQAEQTLADAGLRTGTVTLQYSTTVRKGYVISQDPLDSILVSKGQAINLVVSNGIQYVTVPPLVGLSLADAKTALANAGLKLGTVTPVASTQAANTVLSANPATGQSVPATSAVAVTVSKGPVSVPDLTGQTAAQAAQTLKAAGLALGTVTTIHDATQPSGVVSQSPSPASQVAQGTQVAITVNQPPKTPSPSPSPSASGSPSPSGSPSGTPSPSPS